MSEGEVGPKLYTNKPRKEQLKQFRGQQKSKDFPAPSMGTQTTAPPPPPPPPPPQPKEPFARRYKFLWPLLLAVNLAVGGYLFMRTKKKDTGVDEQDASPISVKDAKPHIAETSVSSPPIRDPLIKREPIPEDQQRELFKWILEEKRKVKPKDAEEKQRIDEEKALLKKFIRSKSIPSI